MIINPAWLNQAQSAIMLSPKKVFKQSLNHDANNIIYKVILTSLYCLNIRKTV